MEVPETYQKVCPFEMNLRFFKLTVTLINENFVWRELKMHATLAMQNVAATVKVVHLIQGQLFDCLYIQCHVQI